MINVDDTIPLNPQKRTFTPQEKIDNLCLALEKLDEKHRNMRQCIQNIVQGDYSFDELSVCDNCEAEMPVTWLDATDGICVFCGKMHTEES